MHALDRLEHRLAEERIAAAVVHQGKSSNWLTNALERESVRADDEEPRSENEAESQHCDGPCPNGCGLILTKDNVEHFEECPLEVETHTPPINLLANPNADESRLCNVTL